MYKDYAGKAIGAKVMSEVPLSDGTQAYQIINFDVDPEGFLTSNFRLMPLIPNIWNTTSQPTAFSDVIGFAQVRMDGGSRPELLFLTSTGVFRYAPWLRDTGLSGNRGLDEQFTRSDGAEVSVLPTGRPRFPAQSVQFGNRIYFNYGDGGSTWIWDGSRLRRFGFDTIPAPPRALGPNGAASGFSVAGRIGTITSNMLLKTSDSTASSSQGRSEGLWRYRVVFEGPDGAYSASSPDSGECSVDPLSAADPEDAAGLRRAFWISDIPKGPPGTVARIILRTPDLMHLGLGTHDFRFAHRIPNNNAVEWIDNIPDGELGSIWKDRDSVPTGFYFMKPFAGSMFLMRTDGYPSRLWWSEQTSLFGATPESILQNHFLDISPSTGAITGCAPVLSSQGDTSSPTLLIFKETATHFVAGQYPNWQSGTVHSKAGLAGPNLVQSAPDNTVLWYGNGTFWAFSPAKGGIIDIGKPIKKRLARVNRKKARFGISWVDSNAGELVFMLPIDDSSVPNMQFIWDSRFNGWRVKEDIQAKAAIAIDNSDLVLISGDYIPIGTGTKETHGQGVYAYGNSYPGYTVSSPLAIYRSGWCSMGDISPTMHSVTNVNDLIVIMRESHLGTAVVSSYQDWDTDNAIESGTVYTAHPEEDLIPYYGTATYDSSLYRDFRTYSDRVALSISSASVFQVKIESSDPLSIMNLDVYGPMVALPGGRTPQ